jgi:hypothetical protein
MDQNRGQKGTPLRTRSFLSLMIHFKEFEHVGALH